MKPHFLKAHTLFVSLLSCIYWESFLPNYLRNHATWAVSSLSQCLSLYFFDNIAVIDVRGVRTFVVCPKQKQSFLIQSLLLQINRRKMRIFRRTPTPIPTEHPPDMPEPEVPSLSLIFWEARGLGRLRTGDNPCPSSGMQYKPGSSSSSSFPVPAWWNLSRG